jgi:NAD(P)H-quinone oxidoreductase subunit 5
VDWFQVGHYRFALALYLDHLNLPFVLLTTILLGLISQFSVRYLHREEGYFRFFLLLHLFGFGALLVLCAASFDLLLAGWELVGLSSVLLVGFFRERVQPVVNGVRVFAAYRLSDLGLLLGIFAMHVLGKTAELDGLLRGDWPEQTSTLSHEAAFVVGAFLAIAAAGKSAQLPFSGWLPRSMEGPTPSSALFYGGISVHLGAYLLLRIQPILAQSTWVSVSVAIVGVATAVHGTMGHRVSSDAKTSLAYATMAQIGLIFAEIALGFPTLALAHMLGHAALRTAQFLRSPSMLRDYHRVHAAAGGELGRTGAHYEQILPWKLRTWLYSFALQGNCLDAGLDRWVVNPAIGLARTLALFDLGLAPGWKPQAEAEGSEADAR